MFKVEVSSILSCFLLVQAKHFDLIQLSQSFNSNSCVGGGERGVWDVPRPYPFTVFGSNLFFFS